MGEERIKSESELNKEEKPLTTEELEQVAWGGAFHEAAKKSNNEEDSK